MTASDHETRHYVRTYLTVFAALMALTIITVAASYLHLAIPLAIVTALAIAIVKGSLVAGSFMHLINEKPMVFVVMLGTAILFAALMLLPILTEMDSIATRSTPWTPDASPAAHMER